MGIKNITSIILLSTTCFQLINGQSDHKFLFTRGENNLSIITTESVRSAQCTVFEYPDFLVIYEIPRILSTSTASDDPDKIKKAHPLISFIDSIYHNKPIKYVLNSHHHNHSLSTIIPFLEVGSQLITSHDNLEYYNSKWLLDNESGIDYTNSIIPISSDTTLLSATHNPIEILYLKKSDYRSIPTKTFLFFHFPNQKLLAASCMVHLQEYHDDDGYRGVVYNDRLTDVNQIIKDKKLNVDKTLQLFRLRIKGGERKPPIYDISYMQNVLKDGWHRSDLAEHLQRLSHETLTTKKDSLLSYLGKNEIYYTVLNQAVYGLIEKKEYQKAVAMAHLLIIYNPDNLDMVDTVGEAYYNNGEVEMAYHYDRIIQRSRGKSEDLGLAAWEVNKQKRLKNG